MEEQHELEDYDPMPFGEHKGQAMQDIPASYLHFLWTKCDFKSKDTNVANYIRRNIDALKMEYKDGIWS